MTYRKVTIKEVARASGVSTQTISRVLNQRSDVAPETRERILQIIAEMGYTPSALARGMIRQRSLTIGVLFSRLNLNGTALALDAISAEADRLGYTLLFKESPTLDLDRTDKLLRSLLDYRVDGIIWAIPQIGTDHRYFTEMDFPTPLVFLNNDPTLNHTAVCLDYFKSGYLATRHLVEQGYQKIGHISGPLDWWEARECKRGWEKALLDSERSVPEAASIEGDGSPENGYSAAARLFSEYPGVDAIFTANCQMALGVLLEASRRGKKVPAELGLVGFDDTSAAAYFCPPLTVVAQDYRMLGLRAMQKLAQLIETENKVDHSLPTQVIIEPVLMARESTAS